LSDFLRFLLNPESTTEQRVRSYAGAASIPTGSLEEWTSRRGETGVDVYQDAGFAYVVGATPSDPGVEG
jgi:hypothetical protein